MGKTKYAACACANDFAVVKTDCSAQSDTTGRTKRLANPEDRADVAGVLETAQDHDQFWRDCEYISERVLARPNCRDDSLGVFRVLDCLESLLRNFKDRVRFYCWHWRAGLAKHVDNFNSAALCFFQEDRPFDRKQPIAREISRLFGFLSAASFRLCLPICIKRTIERHCTTNARSTIRG